MSATTGASASVSLKSSELAVARSTKSWTAENSIASRAVSLDDATGTSGRPSGALPSDAGGRALTRSAPAAPAPSPRPAPGTNRGIPAKYGFILYPAKDSPAPIIRNEELILIRAEANLQLNNTVQATLDIQDSAIEEIIDQWTREAGVRNLERQIGTKSGTGGSTGAPYLRKRVPLRYFPLLWELRDHLYGRNHLLGRRLFLSAGSNAMQQRLRFASQRSE